MDNHGYRLGINTGFAVNRFPDPSQWLKVVGEILDLRFAQFVADLLNPSLPDNIIEKEIEKINKFAEKYEVCIDSTFTSTFTRVNHFSHPNEMIRLYWLQWFKKFIDISVKIGATNVGSHLGIMCYEDVKDERRKNFIFNETVKAWQQLSKYAEEKGIKYLAWEPMSISREYGETIEKARQIHETLNQDSSVPILMCIDVDHGDISSKNPNDTDPYTWLKEFADVAPLIHLKQSCTEKGGFFPFIEEFNIKGKIDPKKVLTTLKIKEAKNTLLLLELSFREREPTDSLVINYLRESVEFWKHYF